MATGVPNLRYRKRRNLIQMNSLQTGETHPPVEIDSALCRDKEEATFCREISCPSSQLEHIYTKIQICTV